MSNTLLSEAIKLMMRIRR